MSRCRLVLVLLAGLLLTACGGGGGGGTPASILSGTAAGGAGIIGQVTIKDSLGATKSSLIDPATGAYSVDVTGMTPPFVLRAEGTVGGRQVQYHSFAQEADVGSTVNITPFTDLIIANASQQLASTFFDSGTLSNLDPADVAAQETALQAKLQAVFDVIGVDAAVDLLHTAFSADRSGLDAVLDMIRIEPNPLAPNTEVIIRNLIDQTTLTDALNDPTDTGTLVVTSTSAEITGIVTDNQAIAALADNFSALFVNGLPTAAQITAFLSPDFLWDDGGASQFATDLSTDPGMVGFSLQGLGITNLDTTNGTADVVANIVHAGVLDPERLSFVVKRVSGTWHIAGNQQIAETYHAFGCSKTTDAGMGGMGCGMWINVNDLDFTNNGTSGAEIVSAKVSLLRDGSPVNNPATGNPAVIYIGTPAGSAAGELVIYDGDYGDDYLDFNDSLAFDLSLVQAGDVLQYELFTGALDITVPASPIINGAPVVTYLSLPELAAPHTDAATASYPAAAATTLTALNAYTGGNLTVAWTVPTGLTVNAVQLIVCDATQCLEASAFEGLVFGKTEVTLSLNISALDQTATSYATTLRIDDKDSSARVFQQQYLVNIVGPAAVVTPPSNSALTCNTESGFDDTADGGLGAPITPHSFADFEAVVADCGGSVAITVMDVAGKSFDDIDGTFVFDTATVATQANRATGRFIPGGVDAGDPTLELLWYIETVGSNTFLVYEGTSAGVNIRETVAVISGMTAGQAPVSGDVLTTRYYYEQSNFSDMVRDTASDGEIWGGSVTVQ